MSNGYIPRLTVEITYEQSRALSERLPHGLRKPLFGIIVDDIIRMIDKHGEQFLAAVLAKSLSYERFTSLKMETKDGNTREPEDLNPKHD